jgi:putative ABC transport system permease protein
MLRNYLTIAVRNLLRHKGYSAINIAGLSIGIACCILILLFIRHELSFDRFHKKADQTYRVVQETRMSGAKPSFTGGTDGALAPALLREFPEVQQAVRMWAGFGWLLRGDKEFNLRTWLVDEKFFDVFAFPLLKGDPRTALREPHSAVITEATARRCFGEEDPVGKMIKLEHYHLEGEYRITGVLKDFPENSMFRFDFLTTTLPLRSRELWEEWQATSSWRPIQTFVVLPEGYDIALLRQKLPNLIEKYMGKEARAHHTYHLQPLTRIHLYSRADYGIWSDWYGDISQVQLLSAIAFFVLLIACINFMNLATARSARRAREVGLRKVVGAQRGQLIRQFLGESMLFSLLALILAVGLAELALPAFRDFVRRSLTLSVDTYVSLLPGLLVVALFAGFLAGIYPAFYLSAFQPVEVLKGTMKAGSRGAYLRKGLVVFQFSVSIFLIVSTAIVHRQLEYIRNQKLGFNKDHLVILPIFATDRGRKVPAERLSARYTLVKREFSQHPNVLKVSAFRYLPGAGHGGWLRVVRPEGVQGNKWQMLVNEVDEDFLETFEIELVAGRNFSAALASDSTAFILNETAVRQLGWTDPIGKRFEWPEAGRKGAVIGVVKDFNYGSLHSRIGPLVLNRRTSMFDNLAVRIRGEDMPETMAFLEKKWKQFVPRQPFSYDFMNDTLGWMYEKEMRLNRVAGFSSLLAIFVACLGLFGLASFTAERRTKEIGIRKVLGASVSDIVALLSKDFLKLVVAANLIAWPVAYWIAEKWLQNFAYRTNVGIGVFALAGGLALGIALLTVSAQAVQAALANPVEALRNE